MTTFRIIKLYLSFSFAQYIFFLKANLWFEKYIFEILVVAISFSGEKNSEFILVKS